MAITEVNGTNLSVQQVGARSKKDLPSSMLERVTSILDAFDGCTARLTLEQVAGRTQLPRSTVYRILDQLVKLDWVIHGSRCYYLGRRAIGRTGAIGTHGQVRAAAAPLLHDLHLKTGMVVHLSVLDERESVYLDKLGGQFAAALPSRVGGCMPAHSTAGGKAMLAWIDPERVDTLFGTTLPPCTGNTITSTAVLHQELGRIRQQRGLAFERGESTSGVACVASAIRGHEGPVASIALCGDIRSTHLERLAPLVMHAAREVSRAVHPVLGASRTEPKAPPIPANTFSTETMDRIIAVSSDRWI